MKNNEDVDKAFKLVAKENITSKTYSESNVTIENLMTTTEESFTSHELQLTSLRDDQVKTSENKAVEEEKSKNLIEIEVRTPVVKKSESSSLIVESRVQDKRSEDEELFAAEPNSDVTQDPDALPIVCVDNKTKNLNGKEKCDEEETQSNSIYGISGISINGQQYSEASIDDDNQDPATYSIVCTPSKLETYNGKKKCLEEGIESNRFDGEFFIAVPSNDQTQDPDESTSTCVDSKPEKLNGKEEYTGNEEETVTNSFVVQLDYLVPINDGIKDFFKCLY